MAKPKLDQGLLTKLAKRINKSAQYVREQTSRKAGRLRISSSAALLLWALDEGLSTTRVLNKLPAEIREEVRSVQRADSAPRSQGRAPSVPARPRSVRKDGISVGMIDSIIRDETLRDRCKKMLQGRRHFDQVFREATTVLDDRLKAKTGIRRMKPLDLVGKAVNQDPQKTIIEVSSDRDEQEGFYSLCKGTMLFFRNRAHHALSDTVTREEALEFCGFIDTILGIIDRAQIHRDRA